MNTQVTWVAGQALRWAKGDAWEQWVNAAADGPSSVAETVLAYLEHHDPFPADSAVEVLRRDGDGWEPATVVERTDRNEWMIEYDDGMSAWRDQSELRPRVAESVSEDA